jgi:hypothetical protein
VYQDGDNERFVGECIRGHRGGCVPGWGQ